MNAIRAINLGGWLVAERWMTPGLFVGVAGEGERAIGRELGIGEARRRLQKHREAFITEADFRWLATHGFEAVRIPVGYWLFLEAKGYVSDRRALDCAFEWADRYNLGVVLDMHGLPGSQNGDDHSGEAGKIRFYRPWHRRTALKALRFAAQQYGSHPRLLGLQIINEPRSHNRYQFWALQWYYRRALEMLDPILPHDTKVIVGDAWRPVEIAAFAQRLPAARRVVLDVHLYRAFDPADKQLSVDRLIDKVGGEWDPRLASLKQNTSVMVGEWSAALDPIAYDGVTPMQRRLLRQRYIHRQQKVFRRHAWLEAYWSYYLPIGGDWSYRKRRP